MIYEEVKVGEMLDHDEYDYFEVEENAGRVSLCTLGSINLGAFRHPEDMRKPAKLLYRALNNLLDYQDFLSIESKMSNEEIRPIGIGITNLSYFLAKRNLKYGEPEALAEIKTWMEALSYYVLEENVELAKERGKCKHSDSTCYGQGIFTWEKRAEGVNELTDFTPEMDWESLRVKMLQYGVRNAVSMAIAPVEACQHWNNKINLSNGELLNFHELLDSQDMDWNEIESTHNIGSVIKLNKPILVKGIDGDELVESLVFNGFQSITRVRFDDGSYYDLTLDHRLMSLDSLWTRVMDLKIGDKIIKVDGYAIITDIQMGLMDGYTYDITTQSGSYLLPNGCISHNSSVVLNSTNGIEMPMSLIQTKESKAGSFTQVVPEYNKLKNRYQLLFDQPDCIEYIKTTAVLQVYVDQSISSNTFYSPHHFPDGKIPTTLVAKNLMLAHHWGLKTHYYNISNKSGVKKNIDEGMGDIIMENEEEDCEACKL